MNDRMTSVRLVIDGLYDDSTLIYDNLTPEKIEAAVDQLKRLAVSQLTAPHLTF